MAKRVVVTVLVFAACIVIYYWYTHRDGENKLDSGNVYSTDSTDLDGRPQVKPTPSRSDAPGTVNTEQVAPGSVSNQPPASAKSTIAGGPAQTMKFATPATANAVPASDSESPNAPNGMHYGGGGRYQWYRQGNLTWRVDSTSGSTCVAFATMEEWRKPLVYSHGCGNA